ncbi:hypothetical protein D3C71_711960 [compost metagenome]
MIDELPMRAHFMPTSITSSMRAEARKSMVALRTYRSPPSECIASSYGSAIARQ